MTTPSKRHPARAPQPTAETTALLPAEAPRHAIAPLSVPRPVEVLPAGAIRSARLLLRPLTEPDGGAFVEAVRRSREHLARFSPLHLPGESDRALFVRQLKLTAEGETTGRACRRLVTDRDGAILGACNLNAIRRGLTSEGDANWWLVPWAIGKGYAAEALSALLAHAFADLPGGLGLHRVLAGIQTENDASLRLAQRLGFVYAGEDETYLHAGGKWDLHQMLIASPDGFEAAQQNPTRS